eukprot:TRINITY_DN11069_c0_g1_i1.p1 TRINITY_DN11069_c0_g1~~TRINITY_DN11069_c0_g1_i1.p1  ORF type:complete len:127 (+),score=25.37 TRINITY_DN11069_c0_g1_i1:73-453(+)
MLHPGSFTVGVWWGGSDVFKGQVLTGGLFFFFFFFWGRSQREVVLVVDQKVVKNELGPKGQGLGRRPGLAHDAGAASVPAFIGDGQIGTGQGLLETGPRVIFKPVGKKSVRKAHREHRAVHAQTQG